MTIVPPTRRPGVSVAGAWLAASLALNGFANYVFLSVAGRGLGPDRFAAISVLWAALFLVGFGIYGPFQQELTRFISTRLTRGEAFGAGVRRVAGAAVGLFAVIAAIVLVLKAPLAALLFGGDDTFVVILVIGIGCIGVAEVTRGVLAGTGRLGRYAAWYVVDGLIKVVPVVAMFAADDATKTSVGMLLALSAGLASVAVGVGVRIGAPGDAPPRPEMYGSLGALLLTSFLAAVVMNIGTVAVEVLASPSEQDRAGVFLSGLVIARVPLFLFQAAQAVLLPRLTNLGVQREFDEFERLIRVLLSLLGAATVIAVAGAAVVGTWVVSLLFGGAFDALSGTDMAMLALASMGCIGALLMSQAQIALHHQRQTAIPWAVGVVTFVVVTAVVRADLFLRVELGMVISAFAALAIGIVLVRREVAVRRLGEDDDPGVPGLLDPLV